MRKASDRPRIEIVYDGACPFCADFTRMAALRTHGEVELIDARGNDPRVAEIAAGRDLDREMALRAGGRTYHGADAMAFVLARTEKAGVWGALGWLLRRPVLGGAVYPALVAGRRGLLRLLGRKPIG